MESKFFVMIGTFLSLLIFSITSHAADLLLINATRLVQAMQLDREAIIALQLFIQPEREKNETDAEKDRKVLECLKSVNKSVYTKIFANEIAKNMSVEEIKQGILFFKAPAGRKFVQNSLNQALHGYDIAFADVFKDFTPNERNDFELFKKTSASKKLLVQGILSSESITKVLVATNEEMVRSCAERQT